MWTLRTFLNTDVRLPRTSSYLTPNRESAIVAEVCLPIFTINKVSHAEILANNGEKIFC